jgi:hypothetical protein
MEPPKMGGSICFINQDGFWITRLLLKESLFEKTSCMGVNYNRKNPGADFCNNRRAFPFTKFAP